MLLGCFHRHFLYINRVIVINSLLIKTNLNMKFDYSKINQYKVQPHT